MTAQPGLPRCSRTRLARTLALFSLFVLLLAQALDSAQREAPWVIWMLRLAPLLVFLPGVLRDRTRSYVWLCFVSLLVFVTLVERLFGDVRDTVAWVAMLAVVSYFNAGMMYVRWRSQELNAAGAEAHRDTSDAGDRNVATAQSGAAPTVVIEEADHDE